LLELVERRMELGLMIPMHIAKKISPCSQKDVVSQTAFKSLNQNIQFLAKRNCPGQLSDLICSTLIVDPCQRQCILETVDVECRMKSLIQFLLCEIEGGERGRGQDSV